MWTAGNDRVEHSIAHNAFAIYGDTIPWSYDQWVELSAYEKQPVKDWSAVVFAALDADAMAECPSFQNWLGFVPNRRQLLDICRAKNIESNKKFADASKHFKDQHLGGSIESV